jgi:hypothetical protein
LNRSAPIPDSQREDLRRLEILALEERDREGYARLPQDLSELLAWESADVWPEESSLST